MADQFVRERQAQFSQASGDLRESMGELDVRSWIKQNPVPASLVALGLGVVAAWVLIPHSRDPYDKLERRLGKAIKDVVSVKEQVENEIAQLRESAESAQKSEHKAEKSEHKFEKRAKKAEAKLEELEHELEEEDEDDDGGSSGSTWRTLMVSALGAQLVHLLTRWVTRRLVTDREGDFDEDVVGLDQPLPGDMSYTPPI